MTLCPSFSSIFLKGILRLLLLLIVSLPSSSLWVGSIDYGVRFDGISVIYDFIRSVVWLFLTFFQLERFIDPAAVVNDIERSMVQWPSLMKD